MTRKIKSYEDLLQEEQRLKAQLSSYESLIKEDMAGIKERLNPVKRITSHFRGLFTRGDNGPLLNFGLNFGIDVVIRKFLLGRAGWVTKIIVPYLVRNYASHVVTEDQRKKVTKNVGQFIGRFLSKRRKKSFESSAPA